MAGFTLNVLPPTLFTLTGIAVSSRLVIPIARRIDLNGADLGAVMNVRVDSLTIPTGDTLIVRFTGDGFASDDFSVEYGGLNSQNAIMGQDLGYLSLQSSQVSAQPQYYATVPQSGGSGMANASLGRSRYTNRRPSAWPSRRSSSRAWAWGTRRRRRQSGLSE